MIALRRAIGQSRAVKRDTAVRAIAQELGYRRVTQKVRDVIQGDLLAATRRGIVERRGDEVAIYCRTIEEYDAEFLRQMVLKAQGRGWHERDEAIRRAAAYLGFARLGPRIRRRLSAAIQTLVRRGELERDGDYVRRV